MGSKKKFKCEAADALKKLRDIILEVDRRCPSSHQIVPVFMNTDYKMTTFHCVIEYGYRDIESQIAALQKLGTLMEYVSNEAGHMWVLPVNRSYTSKWHRDTEDNRHLQVIEEHTTEDTLTEHEGPGGFSFSVSLFRIGDIGYNQRQKARVGLLVAYMPGNLIRD